MATEVYDLQFSTRYFQQNKKAAIADVYDALVEIITNCDDSYHRLFMKTGRQRDGGDILIKLEPRRGKPSRISVYDKAEGMDYDTMKKNLRNVGELTSEKGDRGFMARGIKDCTALGRVIVESIYNKQYSKGVLTPDNKLELDGPHKVTPELRQKFGIHKHNGTVVTLECKSGVKVPKDETLMRDLPMHYALRDIFDKNSDSKVLVVAKGVKPQQIAGRDLYAGTPVYANEFAVEDYPAALCSLKIWKHTAAPLKQQESRLRENGILIKGERAIHECSLFNFEHDVHAKTYCGRLECDYIDELLRQSDEVDDQHFLIDPMRQAGLSDRHPFTQKLKQKINSVLARLMEADRGEHEQDKNIDNAETRKRLNTLAKEMNKLWNNEFEEDTSDADDRALDEVDQRGIYIVPPKFKVAQGEERALTVYIKESCYTQNRKVRVEISDPKVLELTQTFKGKNKPRPHAKRDDIFYGQIKLLGKSLGESAITVRPSADKAVAAEAHGKVVEKREEGDDHDFYSDIEFERVKYVLQEGKTKMLNVFVKKSLWHGKNDVIFVSSDLDEYVEVLDGGKIALEASPHNYAWGKIRVHGRRLTENRKPATITAKWGHKNAQTQIRVVAEKFDSGRFDFKLTSEYIGDVRARWDDLGGNPNRLLISAIHPSIKFYFGDAPDFPKQNEDSAKAVIAELIVENMAIKFLQQEMRDKPGGFKFEHKLPDEVLDSVVVDIQKWIHKISQIVHRVMRS